MSASLKWGDDQEQISRNPGILRLVLKRNKKEIDEVVPFNVEENSYSEELGY